MCPKAKTAPAARVQLNGPRGRRAELERLTRPGPGHPGRNTRRALRRLLDLVLKPGELVLDLGIGTYWLQTGYLVVTDERVLLGISWPFVPWLNRTAEIPHHKLNEVRLRRRPWGNTISLRGPGRRDSMIAVAPARAAELIDLISKCNRAVANSG